MTLHRSPSRARRLRRGVAAAASSACVVALLPAAGASAAAPDAEVRGSAYVADVRWDAYGIPHITASDVGNLGFGNGYATARDTICTIAETLVTVGGRRGEALGATTSADVTSDLFQGWVDDSGVVDRLLANGPADSPPGPSAEARSQMAGYAAGYNAYLDEVGGSAGISDPTCRGEDWVRPVTERDLWGRAYDSALRASSGAFAAGIVGAQPPSPGTKAAGGAPVGDALAAAATGLAAAPELLGDDDGPGSNAYGLGARSTVSGNGMVLGNPHFPWDGPDRFWQSHQTIPGELDVQGAALLGTPGVQIGFTQGVAWSHTVSTARRFAFRALELGSTPTTYVVDGVEKPMTRTDVAVPGGPTSPVWSTEFGPVVVVPDLGLSWTAATAFALQDANADNLRAVDTWYAMNRAQSADELLGAIRDHQGIPWVNTTGADSTGRSFYAQLSVTSGVTDGLAAACIPTPELQGVFAATGIAVLGGTTRACDPVTQDDAAVPGILGPSALPVLVNDTYVTQSNDSHWLSHPDQPLTGFARVIGDEQTARSLRTRLGLLQVQQRLAGTDGLPGTGFTVPRLQRVMFGNRHYAGELVADDLVALCRATPIAEATDGRSVTLAPACDALAGWDRRVDLGSTGAALFQEFAKSGGVVFSQPFDVDESVTTPSTLDTSDPAVLTALADAVLRLQDAGIPLDAPWGTLQTEQRGDVRIPIHGGGVDGVFNIVQASFQGAAGYPDVDGNSASFIMTVEMTASGPVGGTVLTYSQSTDPTSPHHGDQTRLYSSEGFVPIRWREADVAAATVESRRLVGPRVAVAPPDFRATSCPPAALPPSAFPDVIGDGDVAVAVRCLAANGITMGRDDGTYDLLGGVQRRQMVLFLARYAETAGGDLPGGDASGYTDVAVLSPEVSDAVGRLTAAGVVQGRDDGSFDQTSSVTRQQMAAFLVRLERYLRDDPTALAAPEGQEDAFTDDSGRFEEEIDALASVGVAQGTTATTFSPSAPVTRQQMALFLARMLALDGVAPPTG